LQATPLTSFWTTQYRLLWMFSTEFSLSRTNAITKELSSSCSWTLSAMPQESSTISLVIKLCHSIMSLLSSSTRSILSTMLPSVLLGWSSSAIATLCRTCLKDISIGMFTLNFCAIYSNLQRRLWLRRDLHSIRLAKITTRVF